VLPFLGLARLPRAVAVLRSYLVAADPDAVAVQLVEGAGAAPAEVAAGSSVAEWVRDAVACSRCLAWRAWHYSVRIGFASA
jgi:hypothetical protein